MKVLTCASRIADRLRVMNSLKELEEDIEDRYASSAGEAREALADGPFDLVIADADIFKKIIPECGRIAAVSMGEYVAGAVGTVKSPPESKELLEVIKNIQRLKSPPDFRVKCIRCGAWAAVEAGDNLECPWCGLHFRVQILGEGYGASNRAKAVWHLSCKETLSRIG